jgi:hypothetical protein
MAFVLFGGMVALQSSPRFDAAKIAYLVGTAVCLVGAVVGVWHGRRTSHMRGSALWIAASGALVALLAISFFVARADGTPITDWVRDVASYALFAAIPILALDAQASTPRKLVLAMLMVAGLLGGVSWAVEWLGRRDIVDVPISRVVLPSSYLPGMLYLFAMATALTVRRRSGAWVVLAGVMLGLFLLTGTRSSLLLPIAALAMAAIVGTAQWRLSLRTFIGHALVAVALVLAFQFAVAPPDLPGLEGSSDAPGSSRSAATSAPVVVGDRFGSLPETIGNPASDASIKERVAQYEAAWLLFLSSPLVGVGPGHSIDWVDVSGYPRAGFTADTPLVMPAKFGLLGIVVFLGVALAYGATLRAALQKERRSRTALTLVGFGFLVIVGLPLGFLVEDKGASLALMLLLALAFAEGATPSSTESEPPDPMPVSVSRQPDSAGTMR